MSSEKWSSGRMGVRFLMLGYLLTFLLSGVRGTCPAGCSCDDDKLTVKCIEANLEIVPITLNPAVKVLILKNNRIKSLDSAFTFYSDLEVIDLSSNGVSNVPRGSFERMRSLTELNLSSNKISVLTNGTFGGSNLLNSFSTLNLANNVLITIEDNVFKNLTNLRELDLGKNSLKRLQIGAFNGLKNLRTLKVDNNELSKVPSVFSSHRIIVKPPGRRNEFYHPEDDSNENNWGVMPHLSHLYLGSNQIKSIEADAFSACQDVVFLDLHGCKISRIDPNAFRGLKVLRELFLYDNNIVHVPSANFIHLPQVETLKIGRNRIESLPSNSFKGLRKLKNLDISESRSLTYIEKDAFAANLDLESVSIHSCENLVELPVQLFKRLNRLKSVDLKNNALNEIPEDLANWEKLSYLDMNGNPLACNCEIFWLQKLLKQDRFVNSTSFLYCDTPREVRGKRLLEITQDDLNCYLQGPQKTIIIISIAGAIIILVILFVLLFRFHDKIKNTCKLGLGRNPRGKNRSSVASSGKSLDTATKSSFMSSPSSCMEEQYPFIPGPTVAPSGVRGPYVSTTNHRYPPVINSLSMGRNSSNGIHHPSASTSGTLPFPYPSNHNNYAVPIHQSHEYAAPINVINYPSLQSYPQHHYPIPYPLSQNQEYASSPTANPVTEL